MNVFVKVLYLVSGTAIAGLGLSVIYLGFAQLIIPVPTTWFFLLLCCAIGWLIFAWGASLVSVTVKEVLENGWN